MKKILLMIIILSVFLLTSCVTLSTLNADSDTVEVLVQYGDSNLSTAEARDLTAERAQTECSVFGKTAEFSSLVKREKSGEERIADAVSGVGGAILGVPYFGAEDKGFVVVWNCI